VDAKTSVVTTGRRSSISHLASASSPAAASNTAVACPVGSGVKTPGDSFLVYFGTTWTLLRDFGLAAEAALILSVFAIRVLTGLRLEVVLNRRS
jgi:hypothetical protein